MAIIDSQGRLIIGAKAGERLGYLPKSKIAFVLIDEKTYRLADPEDRILGERIVVCETSQVDEKYRFVVPNPIRKMYTREAVIFEMDGSLYLRFIRLKSDDEWMKKQLYFYETDDRK